MGRSKSRSESSVSVALGRLRGGTQLACWLLGLALLVQVGVWSVANFTDLRYAKANAADGEAIVVQPERSLSEATEPEAAVKPVEPVVKIDSERDRLLRAAGSFSSGMGTLAMVLLVPLLGLGVIVAAGSATPGVEHTVSAFAWALILAVLVLPMSSLIVMAPNWGAFTSYEVMIAQVESYRSGAAGGAGFIAFYGRFFVIPLTAVLGSALIGLRFSAGVEAARMPREPILDPELEAEAANISATSLHGNGGRMAGALRTISEEPEPARKASKKKKKPAADLPPATKVSPGSGPNRII